MLLHVIKKLICGMFLSGASGIGEVDRGTVEEAIWSELGALPRSRQHHYQKTAKNADEGRTEHNQYQYLAGEWSAADASSWAG
jgi:hypothetical protein